MEQKLARKESQNLVPGEFQARQGDLWEGSFLIQAGGFYFSYSQNQFLKLTNSCCFHTSDKGCAVSTCLHIHTWASVCVCVQVTDCWRVRVRVCKILMLRWCFGNWLSEVLLFSVFKLTPSSPFPSYLLGDCVLRILLMSEILPQCLLFLPFGDKMFSRRWGRSIEFGVILDL